MAFIYSFITFFQPGVIMPVLASFKPVLLASVLGVLSAVFKKPEYSRKYVFNNIALKFLLVFIIVQIISVYYSGFGSVISHFSFWYKYITFILVSVLVIASLKNLTGYIYGMLLGGQVIVFYGILAVIFDWPSAQAIHGKAGAYGMYENHNDYTFIIIMMLPFTYMLRRMTKSSFMKYVLTFMLLSYILGVLMSLSRGGMLALLFELGLLYTFTSEKKLGCLKILLMISIATGAMAYQWVKRDEVQGPGYTSEDSKSSRFELWNAGKNMFLAHPLLGVGSKRFGEFARDYGEISHDNWGKNSHNTYVEIIATTGLLGILSFYGFIINSIRQLKTLVKESQNYLVKNYALATLVSFYSILVRGFFDAKNYDWSFYILCVISISLYGYSEYMKDKEKESDC